MKYSENCGSLIILFVLLWESDNYDLLLCFVWESDDFSLVDDFPHFWDFKHGHLSDNSPSKILAGRKPRTRSEKVFNRKKERVFPRFFLREKWQICHFLAKMHFICNLDLTSMYKWQPWDPRGVAQEKRGMFLGLVSVTISAQIGAGFFFLQAPNFGPKFCQFRRKKFGANNFCLKSSLKLWHYPIPKYPHVTLVGLPGDSHKSKAAGIWCKIDGFL